MAVSLPFQPISAATSPEALRDDVPVPRRLRGRPVQRGWLVPWFVDQIDGQYDFRIADGRKVVQAFREQRCWLCGQGIGAHKVFVVGPMCAINRVSSEPPSHRDCAEYAARVCPFLTQREVRRRDTGTPDGAVEPPGIMIRRQPGVALLWGTRTYAVEVVDGGVLFRMGDPERVTWLREGRLATRAEVDASIESGYPLLLAEAERDGPHAVAQLQRQRHALTPLLPSAEQP